MLTCKQKQAVLLLLECSEQQVADTLKVRLSTVQRWLRKPEFAEALTQAVINRKKASTRLACTAVFNAIQLLRSNVDNKLAAEIAKLGKSFETTEAEDDFIANLAKALGDD